MTPSEWLREVLQNGSNGISDSVRSALSPFVTLDEETLWTALVLLAGCFSDLAKAGHINSWPANLDPKAAAHIFMHLSSTAATVDDRLNGHGKAPSDLLEFGHSMVQEEL